ncbi:MAG: hypothetical protein ACR2K6_09185 [Solirubrobacterales bacterium]
MTRLVFVTDPDDGSGALASACVVGVAAAGCGVGADAGTAVLDLAGEGPPRSGLLASSSAPSLDPYASQLDGLRAAARGHICLLRERDGEGSALEAALELDPGWLVICCPPEGLRDMLGSSLAREHERAAVLAGGERPKPLMGLVAGELHAEGVRLKIWRGSPSWIAARRALAGLDPGGLLADRAARHLRQLFGLDRERGFG